MPKYMNIQCRKKLSTLQIKEIRAVVDACCHNDHGSLSYPLTETAVDHYLLYDEDQTMCAVLAWIGADDGSESYIECIAFTRPEARNRGYFSALLEQAIEDHNECDILFAVPEGDTVCFDTAATLRAIEAEYDSSDYRMELELQPENHTLSELHLCLLPEQNPVQTANPVSWTLSRIPSPDADSSDTDVLGTCCTSLLSGECVCLHDVEILPGLRGRGYGTRLIRMLASALLDAGIRRIILHVSGENQAAVALYKKTGFRTTETLSYYLY